MLIHVLSARSLAAHTYTFPLRAFASNLRDLDLHLKFFYNHRAHALTDCDALLVMRSDFRARFASADAMCITLAGWQQRTRLLFFDTADSSGGLQSLAFPYVDRYIKPYLLKDRGRYTAPMYGTNPFTDYYHTAFNVNDPEPKTWGVIRLSDLSKLTLGWNAGLGNLSSLRQWGRVGRLLTIFSPIARYHHHRLSDRPRVVPCSCRAGLPDQPSARFQRSEILHRLAARGVDTSRIGYNAYIFELRHALLVISPFGWGEFAYRDYEAFRFGATLVKPDMGHVETYPHYYQPGITYAPLAWDFSDFETTIDDLLMHRERASNLAQAGSTYYFNQLRDGNQFSAFVAHLLH